MDPTVTDDLTNPGLRNLPLFEMAMKGKWDEVVDICTKSPCSLVAGITRLKNTLLHLAVCSGQEDTVRKLTSIICEQRNHKMLLKFKNERGKTILHLAAMVGNVAMCKFIASVDSSLIGERNYEGETPLFTAVFFGQKQAFKCLYDLCPSDDDRYSYSRKSRTDDTILHSAISGDHFDLALRIIELYGEVLVNAVNEDGNTPLHVLANKPSAFRSSSRLGFFKRIIYQSIYVDEQKVKEPDDDLYQPSMQQTERLPTYERNQNHPENYRTCNDFYRSFWNFFTCVRLAMGINVGVQTDEENPQTHAGNQESKATNEAAWNVRRFFPPNHDVCCNFLKLAYRILMLIVLGIFINILKAITFRIPTIRKIYEKKRQHKLSIQIVNKLLQCYGIMSEFYYDSEKKPSQQPDIAKDVLRKESKDYDLQVPNYQYLNSEAREISHEEDFGSSDMGRNIGDNGHEQTSSNGVVNGEKKTTKKIANETALLIAVRNGVAEIVEKILDLLPDAIHDVNAENKNAVLLALENKQPHVYRLLLQRTDILNRDSVFRVVDKEGNGAFHLAAKLGAEKPWIIPGEALQMQWEMKWFKFVTNSIPSNIVPRYNNFGETPEDLFIKTHNDLVIKGRKWLSSTSQSYSILAALIATVAFATSTSVPGGLKEGIGTPNFESLPVYHLFAISSLIALCFSFTALVSFLAILTSRHQARDFGKDIPRKLFIGLTSLFTSIVAILISFCAGNLLQAKDNILRDVAFSVYAATCLPIAYFAVVHLPLYFDLILATFTKVPRRSCDVVL